MLFHYDTKVHTNVSPGRVEYTTVVIFKEKLINVFIIIVAAPVAPQSLVTREMP